MAFNLLTAIGVAATVVGAGATLANNWVAEKKMDQEIEKKVEAAISKKKDEEESE